MKKWYALFLVAVLPFSICGCGEVTTQEELPNNTETPEPIVEETEATVPALDSSEYWDIVQAEIIAMLNSHNLYISAINSSYPCVLFDVEPGKKTDDGKIVAVGLSQQEYEELFRCIKEELHNILDKYELNKPKSAFHACDSVVGIFFYNWFVDMPMFPGVNSWQVASYQLDLLEYYHDYEENAYMRMEGFNEEAWVKYTVYKP